MQVPATASNASSDTTASPADAHGSTDVVAGDTDGSDIAALYRSAVGPVNTAYYLPLLLRFESADRVGPSWNWAASLATLNWLVFRRLWGPALVYFAALLCAAFLLGLGHFVIGLSATAQWCMAAACATPAFLVPGLWGNALLFRQLRGKLDWALAATDSVAQACVLLNRQATARPHLLWLVVANVLLVVAAVASYLAASQRAGRLPPPTAASAAAIPKPVLPAVALPRAATVSAPPLNASVAGVTAAASDSSAASKPVTPSTGQGALETASPASAAQPAASQAGAEPFVSREMAAAAPAATASTPAVPRYFINVGLFAQQSNASRAHAKLVEAGVAAFTQQIDTPRGTLTRVRAGPFDDRLQAEAAARQIQALGLEAVVFER